MKRLRTRRTLRCLSCAAILIGAFEACSSNDTNAPSPPPGEVSVDIASISYGCDQRVAVVLSFGPGWTLRPPGLCATSQCGPVRVTLSQSSGSEPLLSRESANGVVDLPVEQLQDGDYVVTAQLLDNAGEPVVINDGGSSTAERSVHLMHSMNCDGSAAGAGGMEATGVGTGGAGGSAEDGGMGGSAEDGGTTGAGAGGTAGASSAGQAGLGGETSSSGSAGA